MWGRKVLLVLAACTSALWSFSSFAEEIHVISSGGFTEAYRILGPQFEAETAIVLITEYGASSGGAPDSIPMRLARGEPADLIILARYALDDLTEAGFVRAETRTDLVSSKIGMVVQDGAAHPDISTRAALIATLRDAESIAFSASASGTYLSENLFPRLGIWDQIEGKTVRVVSERVGAVVARGEAEFGFQQISELLPIAGVDYVGELPGELQLVTLFSAGVTISAENAEGATRLLDYLSSREVARIIATTGLDPLADD